MQTDKKLDRQRKINIILSLERTKMQSMTERVIFTADQALRWRQLTGEIATEDWWEEIFQTGAFVAGGAALFIVDAHQCIRNVGDIDIWAPVPSGIIFQWIMALCDEYQNVGIKYYVYARGATVTVYSKIMNIQFIRIAVSDTVQDILSRFDLTYCQWAIVLSGDPGQRVAAPAVEMKQLAYIGSLEARTTLITRYTRWTSAENRIWQPKTARDMSRYNKRIQKLVLKGFTICFLPHYYPCPAHDCAPAHRARDEKWPGHFGEVDAGKILRLEIFDETNYGPLTSNEFPKQEDPPRARVSVANSKHRFEPYPL